MSEQSYSIKCAKCSKKYVYLGATEFDALSWPRSEARYAGWSVSLKTYCPECAK